MESFVSFQNISNFIISSPSKWPEERISSFPHTWLLTCMIIYCCKDRTASWTPRFVCGLKRASSVELYPSRRKIPPGSFWQKTKDFITLNFKFPFSFNYFLYLVFTRRWSHTNKTTRITQATTSESLICWSCMTIIS